MKIIETGLTVGVYSPAVLSGNTLYTSGQIGLDKKTGELVDGGLEKQVRQAMENIEELLKQVGLGYKNIVKTTVLLVDMHDISVINEVYKDMNFPARTCYQVVALPKGALVEIEAVAVKE